MAVSSLLHSFGFHRLLNPDYRGLTIRLSLLLGLLYSGFYAQAQCPGGSVNLSTQAAVNAFGALGCPTVSGVLVIAGADITDLSSLTALTSVSQTLLIGNLSQLTNLTGLSSLTSVTGTLEIANNSQLTSLTGLSGLTRIDGGFKIMSNPKLINLGGLSALNQINGRLNDIAAPLMPTLFIADNNEMVSLAGLSSLTSISGHLEITSNPKLTDLTGLNSLRSIGGLLNLTYNPEFISLSGLQSLTSVGGLQIAQNPKLSFCAIAPICQYLANPPGSINIHDNATGCGSQTEIQNACNNPIGITSQPPSSTTVCQGATVTASVSATGTVGSYQWYNDGGLLADQTSATLTLGNAQPSQSGSYSVVISNAYSVSVTSAVFQMTVNALPAAPVLGLANDVTSPIPQNTPSVSLTISDCSGNVNWSGSNASSGSGNSISVPTSATGTVVYSATCTVGGCASLPGTFTVVVEKPQCPSGNVQLTTQSEVEAFGAIGCSTVTGFLSIKGNSITDLSSLSALTHIDGGLYIALNVELTTLTGLNSLTSLGGGLQVKNNPKLTSLSGLNSLVRIDGLTPLPAAQPGEASLQISENDELSSLTGLSSLTNLNAGSVGINDNNKLTDLSALSGLTTIKGLLIINKNAELVSLMGLHNLTSLIDLVLIKNPKVSSLSAFSALTQLNSIQLSELPELTSLTGLDNVTSVTFYVGLDSNPKLTSLAALSALTHLGDYLGIEYCPELTSLTGLNGVTSLGSLILSNLPKLTDLSGLSGLSQVRNNLRIHNNTELTSLSGLSSLTAIGGELNVQRNSKLSFCAIAPLCQYLNGASPDVHIFDNFAGCKTQAAVRNVCNNPIGITSQPPSATTVCQGATVTASVSATGTIGSYQWYKDGGLLADQTSATLTLGNAQPSQSGSYSVVISNVYSVSVTSNSFQLTVNALPAAPVLSLLTGTTLPILQNTPSVSLTITGCSGSANWSGSNGTNGIGTSISVPTSAIATLVYSATCTGGSCSSVPGSFTVSISSPDVSGSFDGFIYGADCSTFRGWAWDRNKPNTVVSVDIFDGSKFIEMIPANEFRQDLKDAGKGNGIHAFRWSIPESMKDGQVHYLSARVAGSSFYLKDSPKALICQGGTTPPANKPPMPPTPTVLIAPLTAQVGVPFSATLAAFTDPEGSTLSYGLSGLPDGLSLATFSRVISGTPTVAGNFALAYFATDGAGATNSVSFVLTVNPASTTTVTGSFEGYLDKVECGTIRGWVWDRNQPNAPVTVEFYTGDKVWGSTVANIYRADLKTAGKGNGAHAYSFDVPAALKDNTTRVIYGRVQGSMYVLKDSGKPLTCPSPIRLSAVENPALSVVVLGNPVSEEVSVEIRGAGGGPLRLEMFDNRGQLVQERQIPQAGIIERQKLSLKNQPTGLLFLRVQASGQVQTVKILRGQ